MDPPNRQRGGRGGQSTRPPQNGQASAKPLLTIQDLPITNTYPLCDIGANLDSKQFTGEVPSIIKRANDHSVNTIIVTGTSEKSSRGAFVFTKQYECVYSTAGVHPHDAKQWDSSTEATLENLAKEAKVVSIGECGLDYDRMFSPAEVQREVCVHCFTGTKDQLQKYLELGCYIGITGWVNDPRRGADLQSIVKMIPLDKIMIETDAPFLIPRDLPTEYKKLKRNEPCLLPFVLHKLASCMGVEAKELAEHTTANTKTFFGLP